MPPSPLARLRKICLSFPAAREVEAWGEPTFRARTIFAMYASSANHHGAGRSSVWVKALATNQELMIAADPERFFSPPYVGPSGWIGVRLDSTDTDWAELRELLWDAWRMSAPPKLVAQYGESPPYRLAHRSAPATTGAPAPMRETASRSTQKSRPDRQRSARPKPRRSPRAP